MPALICDLRQDAAALAAEYRQLRAVGEPLALYWPRAEMTGLGADFVEVHDAVAMERTRDDERIPVLRGHGGPPAWLALEDFDRVLLMSATAELDEAGRELAQRLLAAGAEGVEVVPAAAAHELAQSWHSGRRAGAVRMTR